MAVTCQCVRHKTFITPPLPDLRWCDSWRDPNDPTRGDVHYYNTADNCLDLTKLPRAKFISEYGHLSWPSWGPYSAATQPQDWSYASNMSEFRWGFLAQQL